MGERRIIQQRNLTFILDDRIIVSTGMQSFYLEPIDHRWRKKLNIIRSKIESGEVKTIVDLASVCGGNIRWVTMYRG